jgi:hypothetical protein
MRHEIATEPWLQSQASSREIKVGITDNGTGFLKGFFFFLPSNFYSISVSYSFMMGTWLGRGRIYTDPWFHHNR